jgi:homoserine O-acetyltransferase/O-succinyltransferase
MTNGLPSSRAGHATLAVALALALGITAWQSAPAVADTPPLQRFEIGDFELESGEVIEGAFLTYVTHGELNEARDNAILVLPSLQGTHTRHNFLIGPGLALDPEQHFIIASDTIGNGVAISPSNSETQPGMSFPRFSIRDMVNMQHKLVTEELGLERLRAVLGLSMGGMQTFEWAASHPEMMDAIVPIISMARTDGWVTAIWEYQRRAIMADAAWNEGDYDEQPAKGFGAAIASLMVWVRHWHALEPMFHHDNKAAIEWLDGAVEGLLANWDANNYIYQTWAEDEHNIGDAPGMDGDYHDALRSIQAKALIMPATKDLLHPPDNSREAARYIPDARLVEIPSDLGHLGGGGIAPADIEFVNREIRQFLEVGS